MAGFFVPYLYLRETAGGRTSGRLPPAGPAKLTSLGHPTYPAKNLSLDWNQLQVHLMQAVSELFPQPLGSTHIEDVNPISTTAALRERHEGGYGLLSAATPALVVGCAWLLLA